MSLNKPTKKELLEIKKIKKLYLEKNFLTMLKIILKKNILIFFSLLKEQI